MSRQNESFYYFHDGNKNVTALTDEAGNLVQNYNYKTFGAVESSVSAENLDAVESSVSVENSDAVESSANLVNLFKFSSEYYDFELTRVYYNYHHYDLETGRETKSLYNQASPGRDPIAEQGGVNLYNFVQNNPINAWDLLGLFHDGRKKQGKPRKRITNETSIVFRKEITYSFRLRFTLWETNTTIPYITPFTFVDKKISVIPELVEYKIDNGPSGHSDFDTYDNEFDWTWEAHDENTQPLNWPEGTKRHFRKRNEVIKDLDNAINNCNYEDYRSLMHQYQDTYVHSGKGYGWKMGHSIKSVWNWFGFTDDPDDDEAAWDKANESTTYFHEKWKRNCCKDKNGQWVKRR